ncbi:sigma-70 family RNA polymerase sigma factor [Sorangium sp. So ce291]|uniref:RNA polymerase sigma factor n=1 Tax=Sorangium sp. So ce291 TaxID=3133294 RepID=UPI003F63B42B
MPARTTTGFALFRRLARRAGVPAQNAEDVAQDALLRALEAEKRRELGGDTAPYRVTIALNQARDHVRDARRRGEVLTSFDERELRDEQASPEDLIRARQREALLRLLLDQIEPRYRDLLIKHDLEERPLAEIAAELGLKPETVKTQHRRARQRLKVAKRRWAAQRRARGWDEEACVLGALGLCDRGAWTGALRRLGVRILAQGAFVVLAGALLVSPSSSGRAAWLQPVVTAPGSATVAHDVTGPGDLGGASMAVATAASAAHEEPPSAARDGGRAGAGPDRALAPSIATAARATSPGSAARRAARERERSLIGQARAAIEARNARADVEARRLLERHALEFPRGQLAAEREALLRRIR